MRNITTTFSPTCDTSPPFASLDVDEERSGRKCETAGLETNLEPRRPHRSSSQSTTSFPTTITAARPTNRASNRSAGATLPLLREKRLRLGFSPGPFTFSPTCDTSPPFASLDVDEERSGSDGREGTQQAGAAIMKLSATPDIGEHGMLWKGKRRLIVRRSGVLP